MDGFVHLHVHSHYSLLDGCAQLDDLASAAHEMGMPALAVTDHGNLFGAMEFYSAAKAAGIKPILGLEAYISPTTRQDRSMGRIETAAYHLILLAMNEEGWLNLMKLSSRAYLEGFYYRPRVDRELLSQFNKGLICTTACIGGEVGSAILAGHPDQGRRIAGEYLDIFGKDRFFIEVQNIGIPEQDQANPHFLRIAQDLGVGVVGTNDVHFLRADDYAAHGVLTCISTQKTLTSPDRMRYPRELYLKDAAAMRQALAQLPGAADSTLRIAEMCNLKLDLSKQYLPHFHVPDGSPPEKELRRLATAGLAERSSPRAKCPPTTAIAWRTSSRSSRARDTARTSSSCTTSCSTRGTTPSRPGRAAAASVPLLGYALRITNVDPIRYGLLFERFTDPEPAARRPTWTSTCARPGATRVIQYVRQKYGHVAQIITFGTLKARAVVRDVGRVMDMPLPEVDAIAKLVPETLGTTLQSALEVEPRLRELCEKDDRVRQLIEYGKKLEGLARHAGVHAAGVIVCEQAAGDHRPALAARPTARAPSPSGTATPAPRSA